MVKAGLALGGNLGDTIALLETAYQLLDDHPQIVVLKTSRNFTTSPVGVSAGNRFINSAALIETSLSAEALLDACQQIEYDAGRVREIHWGPRTLDVDIVYFGSEIIETERLTVPHPACWYRRFVLDPLCDIAGTTEHPVLGVNYSTLQSRLKTRPFTVDLSQLEPARREQLQSVLKDYQTAEESDGTTLANLKLMDRPLQSRLQQKLGELYEHDLPGTFEDHLKDVLNAIFDEPTPLQ